MVYRYFFIYYLENKEINFDSKLNLKEEWGKYTRKSNLKKRNPLCTNITNSQLGLILIFFTTLVSLLKFYQELNTTAKIGTAAK